jgi:Ca2+/Na+ antiporter
MWVLWLVIGVVLIVAGAELFAKNLARIAAQLNMSSFALALLLAGAEPEELATAVVASIRGAPGIAQGRCHRNKRNNLLGTVWSCRGIGPAAVHCESVSLCLARLSAGSDRCLVFFGRNNRSR